MTQSNPIKAPALPTDVGPRTFKFDPVVGEEAFSARAESLRAMDATKILTPNCDPSTAALVALQVAASAREPRRAALFAAVQPLLGEHSFALLEQQSWALWYLDTRLQSITATRSQAKLDVSLVERGMKARTRVIRLLDYYLGSNPLMAAELKDIAMGSGFLDLASDLTRLAGHVSVHKERLAVDTMNYSPDDEAMLRGTANEIVAMLNENRNNETADLRNRCWTQHAFTYYNLKSAADFLFRNSPADASLFPPLRTAVVAITSRFKSEVVAAEPAELPEDSTPTSPVAPATPPPSLPATDAPVVTSGLASELPFQDKR